MKINGRKIRKNIGRIKEENFKKIYGLKQICDAMGNYVYLNGKNEDIQILDAEFYKQAIPRQIRKQQTQYTYLQQEIFIIVEY